VLVERLVIEAGGSTFTLQLHPRMTVIGGVGPLEREGLVAELIGALGRGRTGVHLETRTDDGTRLAVFRPRPGRHRVIDVDRQVDVTDRYRHHEAVDLLARTGLAEDDARRAMRLSADELRSRSRLEDQVLALAHVDQARLWEVAAKVEEREAHMAEIAADVGSDPEDTAVFQEIERRHAEVEATLERADQSRRVSFLTALVAGIAVLPLTISFGLWGTVPALLAALAMTGWSLWWWQQVEHARVREAAALQAAGASSYLTFQINRVNGLLSDDQERRRLLRAVEHHRAALAEWHLLAGDVGVDWAVEHRSEIRASAVRLRDLVGPRNQMALTLTPTEEVAADLGQALRRRLDLLRARTLPDRTRPATDPSSDTGPGSGARESLPLFLDEPFGPVEASAKADLLALLLDASSHQQIVLLTDDEATLAWARLEAMTGAVGVVEPAAPVDAVEPAAPLGAVGGEPGRVA
jgi:hypothetical protein